ncbi:hypothetical protein LPJ66_001995 [Kickxella alabastrina]|uniref:Uncharacterized protein n=1 Tax=Kickxella alabastrina TaxID=61397 RepID=A0ACC1IRM8_9FUNG|nr:hypothetical protein LPJ66_001995 [Kickxella alabastrina]
MRHQTKQQAPQFFVSPIDRVFDQKDTTQQVYDDIVKNIITSSMGGFNGTIFAYGQTSSGKTHTMYGGGSELGIIKLAVKNMFSIVENDSKREYLVRVSFLEIYNEVLRDLLEPTKNNLKIHENAKREIFVGDLSEHIVFNAEQVEDILQKGDRNRHIAGTNMNERSSRSHTIFRIVIESREKADVAPANGTGVSGHLPVTRSQRLSTGSTGSAADSAEFTGAVMVSCLNLVDLAGSERVGQTGAEGQRLKEGAHINKSLLSLGTVIARLSEDGGDRGHIPYRDSKLTRILQPSIGGNAKTLIICTITPSPDYVDEAVSTLKFASRAKTIQNKPEVNEELRGDALLRRLKRASELEKEIAQMKEIERKKIKIEADNESLLRQLFKSQRERERLQKELEFQQNNVFLPRATADNKDPADNSAQIRRQTWFSGLQRPVGDGPWTSPALAPASGGLMDFDSEADPLQGQAFIKITREMHQNALDRVSELELANDAIQQQRNEVTKGSKEMEDTIQRYMREYNLLLSTLNQLAVADVIPPSPAKHDASSSSQPPRELVQIRRKLRALMTTIGASQRMCLKFRSQRPEAEFLELELQATRETLLQKEEQLIEALRESDEVFSKLSEAESESAASEQTCQELRDELTGAGKLQSATMRERDEAVIMLEFERNQFAGKCRAQSAEAESRMENAVSALNSENIKLQDRLSELTRDTDAARAGFSEREATLAAELDSARAAVIESQVRMANLEGQLAAAVSEVNSLASQCKLLEKSSAEAAESQAEIARLETSVANLLTERSTLLENACELQTQVANHESMVGDKTKENEQLRNQIIQLTASMSTLELKIADSTSTHQTAIDGYESKLAMIQVSHSDKKQHLESQVSEYIVAIESLQTELQGLCGRLQEAESANARVAEDLARANELSAALPGMAAETSKLKGELVAMHTARDLLTVELDKKQAELGAVDGERGRAIAKIEELESQSADVWDRVSELTVANNNFSVRLLHSEQAVAEKTTQIGALESAVAATEAQITSLKQELDQLNKEQSEASVEAAARAAAAQQALEQHEACTKLEQSEWESRLAEANSQRSAAEQQLHTAAARYKKQLDEIRVREHNAVEHAKQLESSLESLRSQVDSLREDLNATDQSKSAVAELNAKLGKQLEAKLTCLQELEVRSESLESVLATATHTISSVRDEIARKQAAWEQERSGMQSQIAQLQADIASSRSLSEQKHESYQNDIAELRTKFQEAVGKTDQLQLQIAENERVEADVRARLANQSQAHEVLVAELRSDIGQLERKVLDRHEEAQNAAIAADRARKSLEAYLSELDAKCADMNCALVEAEHSRDALSAELQSQIMLVDTLSLSAGDSAKQLGEMQTSHNSEVAALELQIRGLTVGKEHLLQEAAESRAQAESTAAEVRDLNAAKSSAEAQCVALDSQRASAVSELETVRAELEALVANYDSAKLQAAQHIQLAESLQTQFDEFQRRASEQRQLVESLQSDVQRVSADHAAAQDEANAAQATVRKETAAFKDLLDDQRSECALYKAQLEDLVSRRDHALAQVSDLQATLEKVLGVERASAEKLASLDAEIANQKELLTAARELSAQADERSAFLEQNAATRIYELESEVRHLCEQASAKSAETMSLSAKLDDATKSAATMLAAEEKLAAERTRLQSDYEMLAKRAEESQARLEQEVSEIRVELSSKDIIIQGLESALEGANASVLASQTRAQDEARTAIADLEQQIVTLEEALAEAQSVIDNNSDVSLLAEERDQAQAAVQTLKSMMTELAQVKNDEIAELEDKLAQQEETLEASIREALEKDEAIQLSKKLATTHLERVIKAEERLNSALLGRTQDVDRITSERDALIAKLEAAQRTAAETQQRHLEAESELSRLQLEAENHRQAESDLKKDLDRMAGDLEKARAEATAAAEQASSEMTSLLRTDLAAVVKELSLLTGCKTIPLPVPAAEDGFAGCTELLETARTLISAASKASPAVTTDTSSMELHTLKQEVERLQTLSDKLEKKNAKLRDVYKSDMTELNDEEEKQRKRAETLSAELSESAQKLQATEQKLVGVSAELNKQHAQRLELESAVTRLTAASVAAQQNKPSDALLSAVDPTSPYVPACDNGSNNENANLTPSRSKAAMTRLASQRTPLKTDNKRVHVTPKPEAMLSPISSSALNTRTALPTAVFQEDSQLTSRYPTRKRTAAADENVPAAPESAASKAETLRARSTYGDRRRNRRNQPAAHNDGLDEQAAEQCAQQ